MNISPVHFQTWPTIHLGKARARLFPSAAKIAGSVDDGMPGRYWPAWSLPPDATDLDREVYKFSSRTKAPKLKDRVDLYIEDIECPIYAWRVHTFYALRAASEICRDLDQSRLDSIVSEAAAWKKRIRISERILLSLGDCEFFLGGTYLSNEYEEFDQQRLAEYKFRSERRAQLSDQIKSDRAVAEGLDREIERVIKLREGRSGMTQPDYWRSMFFQFMSSLWVTTTGEAVPADGIHLKNILAAAPRVIRAASERFGTSVGRFC